MAHKPTHEELESRISAIKRFNGGTIPLEHALAWEGYLAALLEWSLIDVGGHRRLIDLLPKTPAAPALSIYLGPEGAQQTIEREGLVDLAAAHR